MTKVYMTVLFCIYACTEGLFSSLKAYSQLSGRKMCKATLDKMPIFILLFQNGGLDERMSKNNTRDDKLSSSGQNFK